MTLAVLHHVASGLPRTQDELPGPFVMLGIYAVMLILLFVLGVFNGWRKPGGGGDGGGGGPRRPEQEPTPPGGRQADEDPSDDFEAWESQFADTGESADLQPREKTPV